MVREDTSGLFWTLVMNDVCYTLGCFIPFLECFHFTMPDGCANYSDLAWRWHFYDAYLESRPCVDICCISQLYQAGEVLIPVNFQMQPGF